MFNGISIVCFVEIGYWLILLILRHCFYLPDAEEKSPDLTSKRKIIKQTAEDYLNVTKSSKYSYFKCLQISLGLWSAWSSLFHHWTQASRQTLLGLDCSHLLHHSRHIHSQHKRFHHWTAIHN